MKYFMKAVKPISTVLAIVFLLVSASYQPATAAMVGTEKFMRADHSPSPRDELRELLAAVPITLDPIFSGLPAVGNRNGFSIGCPPRTE